MRAIEQVTFPSYSSVPTPAPGGTINHEDKREPRRIPEYTKKLTLNHKIQSQIRGKNTFWTPKHH